MNEMGVGEENNRMKLEKGLWQSSAWCEGLSTTWEGPELDSVFPDANVKRASQLEHSSVQ